MAILKGDNNPAVSMEWYERRYQRSVPAKRQHPLIYAPALCQMDTQDWSAKAYKLKPIVPAIFADSNSVVDFVEGEIRHLG